MKKRVLGFVAALLLALVGTGLLVAYVRGAEDRALAGEEVVEVFVVSSTIEQGSAGENLEQLVTLEQLPSKIQIEGSIASLAEIEGLVAEVELLPGEQLSRDRFVQPSNINQYARAVEAPSGLLEMTMSLDPQRVVGGSLVPGDTVAIIASFEPFDVNSPSLPEGLELNLTTDQLDEVLNSFFDGGALSVDETPNVSHILAHKVLVTNVQEEERPQTFSEEDGTSTGTGAAPTGNLLVTVALEAPEIERLVFTMEFGRVWLAAEPEEADETGTEIIDRFNVFEESQNQ